MDHLRWVSLLSKRFIVQCLVNLIRTSMYSHVSGLVNDTICIKRGFSLSSMDSAGICYRRVDVGGRKHIGDSIKYIYTTYVSTERR